MKTYLNIHNSNNLIGVWCDPNTTINEGKVYISTKDKLCIIDLTTKQIATDYTINGIRVDKETLTSDDIQDINVTN